VTANRLFNILMFAFALAVFGVFIYVQGYDAGTHLAICGGNA
jgi:hypothetical protein